jgi:hypothetical protein
MFLVVAGWCVPVSAAGAVLPVGVGCAPTAEAAVARMLSGMGGDRAYNGYQVVSLRTDALRRRRWAMVASCVDAARPMVAIELKGEAPVAAPALPAALEVRSGDSVVVKREGDDSRMEIAGVAEEGAAMDGMVRVRMPRFSDDGPAPEIHCRVVGLDVVEVLR